MSDLHGDEHWIAADQARDAKAAEEFMADMCEQEGRIDPHTYDLACIDAAEAEIIAARTNIQAGKPVNHSELSVGLVVDYGDTILRALNAMRLSLRGLQ